MLFDNMELSTEERLEIHVIDNTYPVDVVCALGDWITEAVQYSDGPIPEIRLLLDRPLVEVETELNAVPPVTGCLSSPRYNNFFKYLRDISKVTVVRLDLNPEARFNESYERTRIVVNLCQVLMTEPMNYLRAIEELPLEDRPIVLSPVIGATDASFEACFKNPIRLTRR